MVENQPGEPVILRPLILSALLDNAEVPDGEVLTGLYTDAYAVGAMTAQAVGESAPSGASLAGIDWSSWTPGDVETAQALLSGVDDAEVLRQLLADADVTIKSIADNRLGALARVLADGIATGDTGSSEFVGAIGDLLDDASLADMVATTEVTRALVAGSLDTYLAAGATYIAFLSAEDTRVCPGCSENEDQGPIPVFDQFENGMPPVHPNCRCTIIPASGPLG